MRKVGLVDGRNAEPPSLYPRVVDEVGKDFIAQFKVQLVGNGLRNHHLLFPHTIGEVRNGTRNEVLMNESGIVVGRNALESHAKKIAIGFKYALFYGKTLNMAHARDGTQHLQHRVAHLYGVLFGCLKGHEVGHLYMATKANHLVTNGMLKAENNAHRYQHHR